MKIAKLLVIACIVAHPVRAVDLIEERFKLVNALSVDAGSGTAYVALVGVETKRCGEAPVFTFAVRSATGHSLFDTLLAAKAGNRSVTLVVDRVTGPEPACVVLSVGVH